MNKQILDIDSFQKVISNFARERDWEQFHTPKNLSMALSVEASELVEIFQWVTAEQSQNIKNIPEIKHAAAEEIADILTYLLRISDLLEIDIPTSLEQKIEKNGEKYPIDKAKGNAKKYTEL
jgi:NTP pyrophosphatase (non-canonical NTP hydrolase)